jgi:FkbM family methyltransferase
VELKFEEGWWLPEQEQGLLKALRKADKTYRSYKNRSAYQYFKFRLSVLCMSEDKLKNAVDVGSNIGTWTYGLVDFFDMVYCFEPVKINRECWKKNLEGYDNTQLFSCALGAENRFGRILIPSNSTAGSFIDPDSKSPLESEEIEIKKLDDFEFENVGFIKIDTQGYELNVLEGAKDTIIKNRPCILLEQKSDTSGVEYLKDLGMVQMWNVLGDYFMGWKFIPKKTYKEIVKILEEEKLTSKQLEESVGT